ncbi:LPXTG cell wall anchor domain-containing protein [Pseudoduganella sp. FT26W]|uniref:LPXTG cell wall anchor domain-containing protein n=2 Tax=Duganella aquatilis TaxID=2666082 RepID=A0A844D7Z3_9BURK|nr:LPXTG cell wall anchor domain-containing protein [Duganella aquatilis]
MAAAPAASAAAKVAASAPAAASASSSAASASASMAAQGETEAHAAKAASAEASAGASAGASAAASVPSGPVKQVRVLPKLKYKKEKPVEQATDYTMPLAAGGIGLLALLGAGFFWWRKKKSGSGPLKIWQGFRKKTAPEAAAEPAAEATPESVA